MKPGRKLDALIATKIMGYKLKRDDCNTFWVDAYGEEPTHSHEYSTDIIAAWEVFDKFHRIVLTKTDMPTEYITNIVFYNGMGDFEKFTAKADTAPHAICLAALKAVGVKV